MNRSLAPITTDIVLVGGGHSHVQVMTAFGMNPVEGVRLTLVTDTLLTPYSGMLPGCIAGFYTADEIHIDLNRLARATGTRLIHCPAIGLDRVARQVLLKDRPPLAFDYLSLDVGITPDLTGIEGAAEHAIAVKPIASFLNRFDALLKQAQAAPEHMNIAIVGGGAAGVELAFAVRQRLHRDVPKLHVALRLITASEVLPKANEFVRRAVLRKLAAADIAVETQAPAIAVNAFGVITRGERLVPADAVLISTRARPAAWLGEATGLSTAPDGSIIVRETLQSIDDERVFAVGDCATIEGHPREKAGVFAVRQGPALAANLRRAVTGRPLKNHRPQSAYLVLLSTADGSAIGGRGRVIKIEGEWVFRLKDWIDRRFMAMFSGFGREMAKPPSTGNPQDGMRCGGCAAKIGPGPLGRALQRLPERLPTAIDSKVLVGLDAADDAAIIEVADGLLQVETIDQIKSFIDDPYLFGRIAAIHALSDVYAMGGMPNRALALAGVPRRPASKMEEDLAQMLSGARAALDDAGVTLLGGHSSEADHLTLGFSVTGIVKPDAMTRKGGARPGDLIILTKPIGTGLIFAADMRAAAACASVETALAHMSRSNARAADILRWHGASAVTDVTGFGIAGHLAEMIAGDTISARLDLATLPLYPGVAELAGAGFASTLVPENLVLRDRLVGSADISPAALAILFDPQTSGGLLASIPGDVAQTCLLELIAAGEDAAIIGFINSAEPESAGRIRLDNLDGWPGR